MSGTQQQPAPEQHAPNGQAKQATRRRKRTAAKQQRRIAAVIPPATQQGKLAAAAPRKLPASMPQTLVTQAAGTMPTRLFALGQTLPAAGTRFPADQRAGWLKYAEAILIDAYPDTKAA
jgi:hypothetical protein